MSYSDPPPPPPYGAQPQYGGAPADHPRGTLILVLGILSIPCCGLFTGIPAWIMGSSALKEIDASDYVYRNRGLVRAGMICGIVGTVLSLLGILLNIVLAATGAGTFTFSTT